MKLSEEALQAKREYFRNYKANRSKAAKAKEREYSKQWKQNNREKVKQYNIEYWERKAGTSPLTKAIRQETAIVDTLPPVPTEATIEAKVIELNIQGFSLREIGQQLSISHMKVSRILKDCNSL